MLKILIQVHRENNVKILNKKNEKSANLKYNNIYKT